MNKNNATERDISKDFEGQKLTFVIREAPFEHTGQIKTDQCWLLQDKKAAFEGGKV